MFSIKDLPGERKCQRIVEEMILGNELLCPVCGEQLFRSKKYLWCKHCRKKIRPKSQTWFRGSKMSWRTILQLIWCWQKNVSPGGVKNTLGIPYTTTARWYSRFRVHLPRDGNMLFGIVEADEAYFGRKKFENQKIIIGGIERKEKKLRLLEIPDRQQDSLEIFLTKHIDRRSFLHTDCNPGYYEISWNGFGHEFHNHSLGHFRDTNTIENVWSVAKRQIRRIYGQIRIEKLHEFLPEWEARWNFPHLFTSPFNYLEICLVPH